MIEFTLFETADAAKSALLQWLEQPNWQADLCVDKGGMETAFLPRETIEKIACFAAAGGFFSPEAFSQLLWEFIHANADKIAVFLSRRGPLRSLSMHCGTIVGYHLELQNDGTMTETPCRSLHMILSKRKLEDGRYGFCISNFGPFVTKDKGELI